MEQSKRTNSARRHVVFPEFNNPLYTEISLSQWLAANPARLLEDNFGVTSEVIEKLPKAALGIAK